MHLKRKERITIYKLMAITPMLNEERINCKLSTKVVELALIGNINLYFWLCAP